MKRAVAAASVLPLIAGALGCATKQRVALDCVPREVSVFVDGRKLEPGTPEVELAADVPHTIFFKGGDYEPRMLVFESVEGEAGRVLSPPDVCSQTVFVTVRPEVQIEVDESDPDDGPDR